MFRKYFFYIALNYIACNCTRSAQLDIRALALSETKQIALKKIKNLIHNL